MHNMGDQFQSTSSLLPINTKEQSDVEMLTRIMPTADETTALRVLRKHRGDIERAAAAILEGDTGEAPEVTYTAPTRPASPRRARRAGHGTPVLNHPGEDDELARALQASLESVQGSPHIRAVNFGPSTRAPDPTWAMVPSNVCTYRRAAAMFQ
jgi:CheY-like chemotaxis protein